MIRRRYIMAFDPMMGLGFSRAYWTRRGAEAAARHEREIGTWMVFVVDARTKKAWIQMPSEEFNRDILGI